MRARFLMAAVLMTTQVCAPASARHDPHQANIEKTSGWYIQAVVREATERYRDVAVAEAEGFGPFLGCVSGRSEGAMGIHYLNPNRVGDGAVDVENPEVLIYEPMPNGRLRLVGVEYLTFAEAWAANNEQAPVLEGHVFHYTGSPNRYAVPPHYELHVWAWKRNPRGLFADWNPTVSCESF